MTRVHLECRKLDEYGDQAETMLADMSIHSFITLQPMPR